MNKFKKNEFEKILTQIDDNQFKNKTILITGANGLIGSYIIDFLVYINQTKNSNIKIYALSRSKDRLLKRFESKLENLFFIEQDLNEFFCLKIKPDFIIHAASNAHPLAYSQDPVGTMKTNFIGTLSLLESIKNSHCKFLYISSGEIYGNNTKNAFTENDFGSIDTKLVRSCYPESKRAAETLCISFAEQYSTHINVARLCYVYGPTITESNSRADAQFLRNVLNNQNIVMKSEGLQKRTYCYVADVCSGILTILSKGKAGEFYNISNPYSIASVKDFAQTLAGLGQVKLVYQTASITESRGYSKPADSIIDSTKLLQLGWKPYYGLKEGLYQTLSTLKSI